MHGTSLDVVMMVMYGTAGICAGIAEIIRAIKSDPAGREDKTKPKQQ